MAKPAAVDVVIPVYKGRAETLACLQSVIVSDRPPGDIIVINDASPDPGLSSDLLALGRAGKIRLMVNSENRGFPATANIGADTNRSHDVVLLNSDTVVSADWLFRLRAAAYSRHNIATVTPLSNDATICTYPSPRGEERCSMPTAADCATLDRLAHQTNANHRVEIPTGVGFCMYIRRDCLNEVGLFDTDRFPLGYGEETDFCLRARRLGWRHLAATDVFVGHVGGLSFGPAKAALIKRAGNMIEKMYPGYDALIQTWIADDPLMIARRNLDLARWRPERGGVLMIAPDRGGGITRHLAERTAALGTEDKRAVLLLPAGKGRCRIADSDAPELANLMFETDGEIGDLVGALSGAKVERAEIHHFIDHDPAALSLPQRLSLPYDVLVHDYGWLCPAITMLAADGRYCGEACDGCKMAVAELRTRSACVLAGASRVVVPTEGVARRMHQYFPEVKMTVTPWDDVAPSNVSRLWTTGAGKRKVCLIGAIGDQKGFDVLVACARDAARRDLPLEFVVVGYTANDAALYATGRVSVTGKYKEDEAVALVRRQDADVAFLPSVTPETWCYALSTAWAAGLDAVAFDLGAIAERIRTAGRGLLISPDATARQINDILAAAEVTFNETQMAAE